MSFKAPSTSEFDARSDSDDALLQSKLRSLRILDAARAAATTLALAIGIVVMGLSGHIIDVYDRSRFAGVPWLSAWPTGNALDFKPTVALIAGSTIVVVANIVALTSHHSAIRSRLAALHIHKPLTFTAPFVGFVCALVAIILFYVADTSATADTLTSWSCRWRNLSPASPAPQFASLCTVNRAAVNLAVVLVPIELAALLLAAWELKVERFTAAYAHARKAPSPAFS